MPAPGATHSATADPPTHRPADAGRQDHIPSPAAQGVTTAITPDLDDAQKSRLRNQLDELADPVLRAERVVDMRAAISPMIAGMAQSADLQPHESERLLDFMAESMVRGQQRVAECRLTPGCDMRTDSRARARAEIQEFEQAVGADVVARIETSESLQRVKAFGSTLPEEQTLSDAATSGLATAFAAERRRWIETTEPESTLHQRMRERAATVLTAEQLALFSQKQHEMFAFD